MSQSTYRYSDISKTGPNLVNIDAIYESINNIISTRIGERPFNRDFGSRIEDYLFRPLSFSVSRLILSELISSITKWEKRVQVLPKSEVTINYDTRKYEVVLSLRVVGLDTEVEMSRTLKPKG